jgi:hypothetical protein
MNPADQAQIAAAEYNAEMARHDAGALLGSAAENSQRFAESAEKLLAKGMAVLGKTGNLSTEESLPVLSGIDVGATESQDITDYRSELEKKIADLQAQAAAPGPRLPKPSVEQARLDEIKAAQDALALLGNAPVTEVPSPDELLHAGGSDLLTMVSTRDALERDRRTLMRSAQNEAVAMLKAGDQYDVNADYARQAADWNTWNTILGTGLKIAGLFF